MAYQIIHPNTTLLYAEFMQHKVGSNHKPLDQYEHYYVCSGLWNRGCRKVTRQELENTINWMCTGDWYESADGKAVFLHAYSESDMY